MLIARNRQQDYLWSLITVMVIRQNTALVTMWLVDFQHLD